VAKRAPSKAAPTDGDLTELVPEVPQHLDTRTAGWPPLLSWWPTYVLVAAAAILAVLAAAQALLDVLRPIAHLITVFVLAVALAFALAPLVRTLERVLHRRGTAVAFVVVAVLAILAGVGALVASPLTSEAERLTAEARAIGAQVQRGEPLAIGPYAIPAEVQDSLRGALLSSGGSVAAGFAGVAIAVASGLVDLVLVAIITVYLLLDAPRIRVRILRVAPRGQRTQIRALESEVGTIFGAYLRAQLLLAIFIAVAVGVLLLGARVPYAIVLAIFAGIAELIPMFGPVIGGIPAVLVAATQPFPTVLIVLLGFVLIQQIEANVLVPRFSGHAVGLHPLGAMLALLAGFEIGGIVAALVAVPVAGLVWVFMSSAVRAWRHRRRIAAA
jgi:predicted PurR-regulated permease PerM